MTDMRYTTLGRTGLKVSIMGIGAGTQFGTINGNHLSQAEGIINTAIENGINLIDTASIYNSSEEILGRLLESRPRESYVLNSKYYPITDIGQPIPAQEVRKSVERSLKLLDTDYLDVLQIHGVRPESYRAIVETHHDELMKMKSKGMFRFLGITETIKFDPHHRMMKMALKDDLFDTAMIAYSLLSPDPEIKILPQCQKQAVGVIGMTAVRRALSDHQILEDLIRKAKTENRMKQDALPDKGPLDWLLDETIHTLASAGYSYVLSNSAVQTVLSGTTNPDHLVKNLKAALSKPLDEEKRKRLRSIFSTPPDHQPWSTYDL
ncbi:MAG: aldo/keto reductase [Verrucomicrobia bacterium]|nr:aldo/keto reductase [Verrucomicrobiota bacterium]